MPLFLNSSFSVWGGVQISLDTPIDRLGIRAGSTVQTRRKVCLTAPATASSSATAPTSTVELVEEGVLVQVQTNKERFEDIVLPTDLISDWLACLHDGVSDCYITHKGEIVEQNQTFEDTNIQDGDVLRLVEEESFNFGLAAGVKGKTNGGGKAPAFTFGYARTKQPARKSNGAPPPSTATACCCGTRGGDGRRRRLL